MNYTSDVGQDFGHSGRATAAFDRRAFLRRSALAGAGIAAAGALGASGVMAQTDSTPSADWFAFDPETFTLQTSTVTTAAGDKSVTFRAYEGLTYVANPVDAAYQSLNVNVPVEIDGTAIDASGAPILLNLNIGGYMSSSVTGGGSMSGAPSGDPPDGGTPPSAGGVPSGSGAMTGGGQSVSNGDLALAAGFVVVSPGARGRDNVSDDGTYYGKAPAAIVDLKAAVRYVRANAGLLPGNVEWIVSSGSSAGGALSTLLGASGDSPLYEEYLDALGAADASDAIFGTAGYCPITDLEHADMAYEWMFGALSSGSGEVVDQAVSAELGEAFAAYLTELNLSDDGNVGTLTASTMGEHLVQAHLQPAATTYLAALSETDRSTYLEENPWITWDGVGATFTFADFQAHLAHRSKDLPAFDAYDLSAAENVLFGNETTDARHFTLASLRQATGDAAAELESDLPTKIDLMNPMYFLGEETAGRAKHWWLRVGTSDTDTSLTVVAILAATTKILGDDVNTAMYWDAGHGANEDAEAFIAWIGQITGYAT